jgi:hypothetical protein
MNFILRTVKHKRPAVRTADSSNFHEKNLLRLELRKMIEYLEKHGDATTGENMEELQEPTQRVLNVVDPDKD